MSRPSPFGGARETLLAPRLPGQHLVWQPAAAAYPPQMPDGTSRLSRVDTAGNLCNEAFAPVAVGKALETRREQRLSTASPAAIPLPWPIMDAPRRVLEQI